MGGSGRGKVKIKVVNGLEKFYELTFDLWLSLRSSPASLFLAPCGRFEKAQFRSSTLPPVGPPHSMDSLFTVRCFSCGKVVGGQTKYQKYRSYIDEEGMQVEEALNELRIFKWCCRARFRCFVPNLGEGYPVDPTIIRTPEDAEALLPPINTSKIGSGPTNYEEDYE